MNEIGGKLEAQRRADRLRILREELRRLEQEGVLALSDDQRRAVERHTGEALESLAGRFDIDTTETQKRLSRGMRIASTVGGLAFCAAVVLFFYRYWGLLAAPWQAAILIATPLFLTLAAEFAARRERTLYFASLLSLVAFAGFVTDLNMLAGIFNLAPSPGGFLAWGLFALALAWRFGLRLQLAIGVVCLMFWSNAMVTVWAGYYWPNFPDLPEPLIAAAALVVAAGLRPGRFSNTLLITGVAAAMVAMLSLSLRISVGYLPWSNSSLSLLYQLAGMLAAAGAIWFGIPRGLNALVNLSATGFVVFLYCRLAAWWWDWMPKYLFFLIIGLISLALLVVFRHIRKERLA